MPGRETTVAPIPSDNAAFEEGPAVATAVLHRGIEANLLKLRRYARSLTRDAVAADDLVQECIARALAKVHPWRAGTDLTAQRSNRLLGEPHRIARPPDRYCGKASGF